jgi:hypothetical protein
MYKSRVVLSTLALFFGFGVLALSLTTATAAESSTGSVQASSRQLYWDSTILPDHVAYPVLMTIDKVRLEAGSPSERVFTQIEYGHRRLEYAQELLDKKKIDLAVTTASKGYKYLLQAGEEALQHDMPHSVTSRALKALEYQSQFLSKFKAQVPDQDRPPLDILLKEGEVMMKRLQTAQPQE